MNTPSASPKPPSDRKQAILAAALAVFSDKGVEAATIDDIRQHSKASVGSIYHHFGTKEAMAATLFIQGLDDYWSGLIAAVQQAPTAERAIHGLIAANIAWIVAHPDLARFMFSRRQAVSAAHEQAVKDCTAGHFKGMLAALKPWFTQGILRRLPHELYSPLLLSPSQELVRGWLSGRSKLDPRTAVDELSRAAWLSLACDPAQHGARNTP
jgi:AcrR family transcriptional regulator